MSSPVGIQFSDGMDDISVVGAIGESDFDCDVVKLGFSPVVQPRLLLRVGTEVVISIGRTRFRTIELCQRLVVEYQRDCLKSKGFVELDSLVEEFCGRGDERDMAEAFDERRTDVELIGIHDC
jgi:hypothetical protein